MAPNRKARLIAQLARQRGLDPAAVLAVASTEGGFHGAIGDHGTSFGPFQLHIGGALPRELWNNPRRAHEWANNRPGIEYALDRIQEVAAGLTGRQAIENIVRRFERPADPDAQVQRALSRYPQFSRGQMAAPGPAGPAGPAGPGLLDTGSPAAQLGADAFRSMAAATLLDQSRRTLMGESPDSSGLLSLALARKALGAAQQSFGPEPSASTQVVPARSRGPFPGLEEAFHDPVGAFDSGRVIDPIGGHADHVHLAFSDPQSTLRAIRLAQQMGLAVRENPYTDPVDPVHTQGSFHYQTFPGRFNGRQLGRAIDVSGDPEAMARLFRLVTGMRK